MNVSKSEPGSRTPQLGDLEAQVMDLLWQQSPRSVRNVIDALDRRPAYTTIATVMQNLQRKGLVRSKKDGRSVFFLPEVGREEHTALMMRHALAAGGDPTASILHFVKDMPQEEAAMLRQYLNQNSPGAGDPA